MKGEKKAVSPGKAKQASSGKGGAKKLKIKERNESKVRKASFLK